MSAIRLSVPAGSAGRRDHPRAETTHGRKIGINLEPPPMKIQARFVCGYDVENDGRQDGDGCKCGKKAAMGADFIVLDQIPAWASATGIS